MYRELALNIIVCFLFSPKQTFCLCNRSVQEQLCSVVLASLGFLVPVCLFCFFSVFSFVSLWEKKKKKDHLKRRKKIQKNPTQTRLLSCRYFFNSLPIVVFQISFLFLFHFFHFRFCYSIKKWTFYSPRTWPKVAMANHLNREVHGALHISASLKFERP